MCAATGISKRAMSSGTCPMYQCWLPGTGRAVSYVWSKQW